MKITRLHLILISVIIGALIVFSYQVRQTRKQKEELAAAQAQELQRIKAEQENIKKTAEKGKEKQEQERSFEYAEKKQKLAIEAIAVAGEYWQITKKENRDYTAGQATLHKAKESLNQNNFDLAWELAHQSIREFKEASQNKELYYKVKSGDCLWKIAKMPQHYGRGSMWPKIWHANKKKIPNYRLIYPKQVFLIPLQKSANQIKVKEDEKENLHNKIYNSIDKVNPVKTLNLNPAKGDALIGASVQQ